jgi:hypothetical protein
MSYAVKLPLICSAAIDFDSKSQTLKEHVFVSADAPARITQKKLSRAETVDTLYMLPADIRKYCLGVSKTEIHVVGPHVHTHERCVINFYYRTNGEITVFYDGDYAQDSVAAIDKSDDYYMVKPAGLREVLTYTAVDGDVWLLNTQKAHAVIGEKTNPRQVLQAYLSLPYEQVLEYFLPEFVYAC